MKASEKTRSNTPRGEKDNKKKKKEKANGYVAQEKPKNKDIEEDVEAEKANAKPATATLLNSNRRGTPAQIPSVELQQVQH